MNRFVWDSLHGEVGMVILQVIIIIHWFPHVLEILFELFSRSDVYSPPCRKYCQ